jgi:hypothetical protein
VFAFIQMMYSERANIPHIAATAIHARIFDLRSGSAVGPPSVGFAGSGRVATGELPTTMNKGVVEVFAVSSSVSTVNLLSHRLDSHFSCRAANHCCAARERGEPLWVSQTSVVVDVVVGFPGIAPFRQLIVNHAIGETAEDKHAIGNHPTHKGELLTPQI